MQGDDVEAVVEVVAEAALADQIFQVHVGGGQDAHIHFDSFVAAQAHELAFLDDAQQLGLGLQADGANLVEEDGSLVRHLKQPLLGSHGAGKGAFDVTEQDGLQQVIRHGAGVDGNEVGAGTRAEVVEGVGDHFLAGAALAGHQHGGAGGGDVLHQIEHFLHGLALADQVFQPVTGLEGAAEMPVFFFQFPLFNGPENLRDQLVGVPGLGDVVLGAVLEGGAGDVDIPQGGQHDDGQRALGAAELLQHRQAAAAGELDVQQHQVAGPFGHRPQAAVGIDGEAGGEAVGGEQSFEGLADVGFVVHDQDVAAR